MGVGKICPGPPKEVLVGNNMGWFFFVFLFCLKSFLSGGFWLCLERGEVWLCPSSKREQGCWSFTSYSASFLEMLARTASLCSNPEDFASSVFLGGRLGAAPKQGNNLRTQQLLGQGPATGKDEGSPNRRSVAWKAFLEAKDELCFTSREATC